jgi:hypothetical protein
MLCQTCQNIVFTRPSQLHLDGIAVSDYWINNPHSMLAIHHASLGTLKQSADHGCHLCAMFWGGFFVTGAHRGVDGGDERDKGITKVVLCRDWPIEWTANNSRGLLFAEPIKIQCGKFRCSVFGGLPLPGMLCDAVGYAKDISNHKCIFMQILWRISTLERALPPPIPTILLAAFKHQQTVLQDQGRTWT